LAIVALLALLAWYLLNPGSEQTTATVTVTANGQALNPWHPTRLTLNGSPTTSLALIATSDDWPTDGQAHMHPIGLPLRICVPDAALSGATTITILSDGSTPERVYAISSSPPDHPDLVISPCEDPARQVAGVIHTLHPAPLVAIGTDQPIGEGLSLNLNSVTVIGPAESSDVPQGAARVNITLLGTGPHDWTAYAPTLRLGDGSAQTAPDVRTSADGTTELRFLVSAPSEPLPAEFRLTDPATRLVTRWQVPIGMPINRLQFLRNVLRIDGLTSSGERDLAMTITNTSSQPLNLMPTDLTLEQDGSRQLLTSIRGIDTPLDAGETRSLTLSLPPDLHGGATLRLGTAQYRLIAE
jgi:hypothetical protein